MINIVLYSPLIPMNTGNIARTCAVTGSALHLIKPLGFDISDSAVKRAGLDYWHLVEISVYEDAEDFFAKNPDAAGNIWLSTTRGSVRYCDAQYTDGCYIMFGQETKGLPDELHDRFPGRGIRLPMREGVRCLNLANSVCAVCYEALRQTGFKGLI